MPARSAPRGALESPASHARNVELAEPERQRLALLEAVVEGQARTGMDAFVVLDPAGGVLGFNRRFRDLWGLSEAILRVGAEAATFTPAMERLAGRNPLAAEPAPSPGSAALLDRIEMPLADGRVLERYGATIGPDGAPQGQAWFFRDVTRTRRAEEKLWAANARLRQMDVSKTEFLLTAAHELAAPLRPIKAQASLLRVETEGRVTVREQHALDILERNVDRLDRLAHELLDLGRLESGSLPLRKEAVDLSELASDAFASYKETARVTQHEYKLVIAPGLWVDADPGRLLEVLYNLISNAINFTPKGGRVEVRTRRDGPMAVFEVQDTGVGLRPEDFPKLFQPFPRVNPGDARTATSGVGLSICERLVQAHGGRIWCDSPGPDQGSTFAVALPLSPDPAPPATEPGGPAPKSWRKTRQRTGFWPLIYFRCPSCDSRDIEMFILRNRYECTGCKHQWR